MADRAVGGPRLEAPDYVVLIVGELERSLAFYTGVLGLRLRHRSGPYAQLDTGRTRLALFERAAMAETVGRPLSAPGPQHVAFEIGFKVEDVDQAWSRLCSAGARPVAGPTDRPWGQRSAYVADPDGNLVELAQDLDRQG
jgi:lactoylglutathione lyase